MPCNPRTLAWAEAQLGRALKKSEIKKLDDQADRLTTVGQQRGKTAPEILDDAIRYANQMVQAERVKALNSDRNEILVNKAMDFIDTHYGDRPDAGLETFIMGSQSARFGSRASVARDISTKQDAVLSAFHADLEKAGPDVVKALTSNSQAMEPHIAKAMWQLDSANPNLAGIPRVAVDAARIINKHNEMLRVEANKAGAWIGKEKGYLTRRGHDQLRIRADKEGWMAFMRQNLDLNKSLRMTDTTNVDDALEVIYGELAAGSHINFRSETDSPNGFTGMSNVAKGMSQERVFNFKMPEMEIEYMRQFGFRTLSGSVMQHMNSMARDVAIMNRMGTNPEMMFNQMFQAYRKKHVRDPKLLDQIDNIGKQFKDRYWPTMSGASGVIAPGQGHLVAANIDHFVRSVNRMSLLPFILPSQIPDLALRASQMARDNNSFFGGMIQGVQGVISGVPKEMQHDVLQHLGVSVDGSIAMLASRYDASDHLPGKMTAMEQYMFKYSGAQPWTDRMRTSAAMTDAAMLARLSSSRFDRLDPDMQRSLQQQGIDATLWAEAKNLIHRAPDGQAYLVPTMATDTRVRDAFQGFFHDRATTAVLTPDMKTRAALTRGAQQGTLERVLWNQIGALKAFPVSVLQRVMGAELLGRTTELPTGTGVSGALSSLKIATKVAMTNRSAAVGITKLMVAGTLLGYSALYIKDLVKGRSPRQFSTDEGSFDHNTKLMMQAMAQGGALGIYGDFLQGDKLKNRYGGNVLTTALGPGADDLASLSNILGGLATGEDVGDDMLRFGANNLPFAGTGPLRTAVDYLFLHEMMEYMKPGYVDRMKKRIKRDMDQDFNLNTFSEDFLQ